MVVVAVGCTAVWGQLAAETGGGPAHGGSLPEFQLEYDVERAFGKSREWTGGVQVDIGFGQFDGEGFSQFSGILEDETADQLVLRVDWHQPVRRELSPFGFYVTGGIEIAQMTWAVRIGDDMTATLLAPRVAGGYAFNFRQLMLEVGLFAQYGLIQADDFDFFGRTFEGQLEEHFGTGLELGLTYSFAEGRGPELGLFLEAGYRRVQLAHEAPGVGGQLDLLTGLNWAVGGSLGWRF